MTTKKKANSRRPSPRLPPGVEQIRDPSKELRPLIKLLDDVCSTALVELGTNPPTQNFDQFDRAILTRGLNMLEAIRALAIGLHWEVAATSARQLFELVINMEWLKAMPDREAASVQFARFGMLQQVRALIEENTYGQQTGRDIDQARLQLLKDFLASAEFAEFRRPGSRDGWAATWNGQDAWKMTKASENEMRIPQYNQLFKAWSREAHAAPGALLRTMMPTAIIDTTSDIVTREVRDTSNVISMAVMLFGELWMLLVNVPPVPLEAWNRWMKGLHDYFGTDFSPLVVPPPSEPAIVADSGHTST